MFATGSTDASIMISDIFHILLAYSLKVYCLCKLLCVRIVISWLYCDICILFHLQTN